nr:MAG TPA: hypothetical protein [Caudoviricetes sp.]
MTMRHRNMVSRLTTESNRCEVITKLYQAEA